MGIPEFDIHKHDVGCVEHRGDLLCAEDNSDVVEVYVLVFSIEDSDARER